MPIPAQPRGPGGLRLPDSRPRWGERRLGFNQLPSEALRSCKATADPATFCNWDQVLSWSLERRLWGAKGPPRPGPPNTSGGQWGPGPLPVTAGTPGPLPAAPLWPLPAAPLRVCLSGDPTACWKGRSGQGRPGSPRTRPFLLLLRPP